jgi:uncharacterized membrane protein YeaQ/YmgE (transglycosylase-associated protein family)
MQENHVGVNIQQVIAGFIGATIMVLRQKDKRGIATNIASVIAGTASATYLTPLVGEALNQTNPTHLLGFAFLLGVLGLRSIELVADYVGLDGKPGIDKPIIDITKE